MQHRNTLAGAAFALVALLAGCSSTDPAPEPAPEPVAATVEETDPDMKPAAARGSIAVRNDNHPLLRVVFLNNFGRPHAEQVEAAMGADAEFSELLADYAQANRISIECKYTGADIRQSLKRVIDQTGIGIKFHFREAELPKHVEVWRTKE